MTLDEMKALPKEEQEKIVKKVGALRKIYKAANYACVYGAGGATVARSAGISEREGVKLVEAYWKRNWSVEAIANSQTVKQCRRQKWLYNPVSKLWYSLRAEKGQLLHTKPRHRSVVL